MSRRTKRAQPRTQHSEHSSRSDERGRIDFFLRRYQLHDHVTFCTEEFKWATNTRMLCCRYLFNYARAVWCKSIACCSRSDRCGRARRAALRCDSVLCSLPPLCCPPVLACPTVPCLRVCFESDCSRCAEGKRASIDAKDRATQTRIAHPHRVDLTATHSRATRAPSPHHSSPLQASRTGHASWSGRWIRIALSSHTSIVHRVDTSARSLTSPCSDVQPARGAAGEAEAARRVAVSVARAGRCDQRLCSIVRTHTDTTPCGRQWTRGAATQSGATATAAKIAERDFARPATGSRRGIRL